MKAQRAHVGYWLGQLCCVTTYEGIDGPEFVGSSSTRDLPPKTWPIWFVKNHTPMMDMDALENSFILLMTTAVSSNATEVGSSKNYEKDLLG